MKTHPSKSANTSGSVLVVSLIIAVILGAMLVSFLGLAAYETVAINRSQDWNSAMAAAEAGVEEGLAMINVRANTGRDLSGWTAEASQSGWTYLGDGVFSKMRVLGDISYTVFITNKNNAPVIKSVGSVALQGGGQLSRSVLVENSGGSYFLAAVLAKRGVTINGNVTIDSFDSQDPAFSTDGSWDITKRKDGGNVGSVMSNVVTAIKESGKADIYGQLATGPGSGASVKGAASAGSLAWVGSGKTGVEPGWLRNDLNVSIPDAPPLQTSYYTSMPSPGDVTLSGHGGTVYYLATSNYQMQSSNRLRIVDGTVVIHARSGMKLDAKASIEIDPGAKLIIYLGTENTQLNGQGVVNKTGIASNCIIYGQNNCRQIEINGASTFVGYVYAPYADITLNGNADFIGAVVGDTFQIDGNMSLHYDESLRTPQEGTSVYRTLSWREVPI
jgi:Tfp pilus assembly protein PilX